MAEVNKKKTTLLGFDPVETPEEVIEADKDIERKEAFKETYKRIAKIIPEYFMTQKKKRKNSTSGGTAFSQNIVVTPDKVTLQTKEVKEEGEKPKQEEKENERGD